MAFLSSLIRCPDRRVLFAALSRSMLWRQTTGRPLESHCQATYSWLCAAHDATPDGGVAAWYHLLDGWSKSYPETTGYLVPTILAYGLATGTAEATARALRMADWEVEVQLPTGAVESGLVGTTSAPAVFNTGQVLFAFTAADQAGGGTAFVDPARRAARWLISVQDEDGAWRRDLSALTTSSVQTYNVRSAWALAEAGDFYGEPDWIAAAKRNADWALGQQEKGGWYARASFGPGEPPLLHTIAYAIEGFLGLGLLLGDERYVASARCAVDGLLAKFHSSGRLVGRYDTGWQPRAGFRCLTGEAQMASVLFRLSRYLGADRGYFEAGRQMLDDLCRVQDLNSRRPPTYGGLAGSFPVWGEYCTYSYINWAAKFHLDAMLQYVHGVDPHLPASWGNAAANPGSPSAGARSGDDA